MAGTSIRAHDLDKAKALEAKRAAEEVLQGKVSEMERATVLAELAQWVAQLEAIKKSRKRS